MGQLTARKIGLGLGVLPGLMLMACVTGPVEEADGPGRVTLEISAETAPGVTAPDLRLLEVMLVSGTRDTLRDTITRDGSRLSVEPAWLDGRNGFLHLFPRYELKAGRRWTAHVRSVDGNDSVVHVDSLTVGGLRPFEYRDARLDLTPRWAGYAAQFTVPAKLPAAAGPRAIRAGRVELRVDDEAVRDTVFTAQDAGRALVLPHPYVATGTRRVELRVYGVLEDEPEGADARLLLRGGTTLDAGLARAAVEEGVALSWVDASAPDAGGTEAEAVPPAAPSGFEFRLGAIGIVRMNVHISGGVIL